MIDLRALLPTQIIESHEEKLSALCMCTAELKYLIFNSDYRTPQYVVQIGSQAELATMFENTKRLYGILPHRVPEPLDLVLRHDGSAVLVLRGLPGRPWFTLHDEVRTSGDWTRVKDISLEALHEFHAACASQLDWVQTLELANMFDNLCLSYEQIVEKPVSDVREVFELQRTRLETLGTIECFRQHGDFCVNNLLFRSEQAGIIDFEQFGRVMLPLHDEFLLVGSLLARHPARNTGIEDELWQEILEGSIYKDRLGIETIEALFQMYLMWWIVEADGQSARKPMAQRYRRAFNQLVSAQANGIAWAPGQTVI